MAKILFTWELGEGTGHIMPYVELISKLVEQGHEVHFALRSLHKAYDIFNDLGVTWHQAPTVLPRHVNVVLPVDSYAKVLHNAGYDTPSRLMGMIKAWRNLYNFIKPDLIVFDYSPTAMLSARNYGAKTMAIGTGFHIPPSRQPLPGTDDELGKPQDAKELESFELDTLKTINESLNKIGMDMLTQLSDLFQADKTIFRTLPEMDHYSNRGEAHYAGVMKSPQGAMPAWPRYPGPRIFAYLKKFETLPDLLNTLNKKRYPTLIYGDKLPNDLTQEYFSDTLHFASQPLDMDTIGKTATVAITNAGHGSTTELLLSGVPMLLLPLYGEQQLVANNVERIGAGLAAPGLHPGGMEHKLERLINEPQFKENVEVFAKKYRETEYTQLTDNVLNTIVSML